jgi:hypothetical protein
VDADSLELLAEADVGVHARRVLVEVEEGPRPAVEDAALPLDEPRNGPDALQERLQLVQRSSPRDAHRLRVCGATDLDRTRVDGTDEAGLA